MDDAEIMVKTGRWLERAVIGICLRNIETLRKLGHGGWDDLWRDVS